MEIHYKLKGTNQPKTAVAAAAAGGVDAATRNAAGRSVAEPTATTQNAGRAGRSTFWICLW